MRRWKMINDDAPFTDVFSVVIVLISCSASCVDKSTQTREITKRWKRESGITWVSLERVSKRSKRWAYEKHHPLDLCVEGHVIVKLRSEQTQLWRCKDHHLVRGHEELAEVEEVLAKKVRKRSKPTGRIHNFMMKWKNLLVEETNGRRTNDCEACKQKIEEF